MTRLNSPACTCPSRRFAGALTNTDARFRVVAGRYSFDVELFHLLLHAGLSRRSYETVCPRAPRRYSTPHGANRLEHSLSRPAQTADHSIGATGSHVLSTRQGQARAVCMPGAAWAVGRLPPDLSRDPDHAPVLTPL